MCALCGGAGQGRGFYVSDMETGKGQSERQKFLCRDMLVFVTIQAYMLLLFISLAAACFRTDFNMKLSFVQCMDSTAVPIIMLQLSCAVCLVHTTSMMTAYKEVMKRKKCSSQAHAPPYTKLEMLKVLVSGVLVYIILKSNYIYILFFPLLVLLFMYRLLYTLKCRCLEIPLHPISIQ